MYWYLFVYFTLARGIGQGLTSHKTRWTQYHFCACPIRELLVFVSVCLILVHLYVMESRVTSIVVGSTHLVKEQVEYGLRVRYLLAVLNTYWWPWAIFMPLFYTKPLIFWSFGSLLKVVRWCIIFNAYFFWFLMKICPWIGKHTTQSFSYGYWIFYIVLWWS